MGQQLQQFSVLSRHVQEATCYFVFFGPLRSETNRVLLFHRSVICSSGIGSFLLEAFFVGSFFEGISWRTLSDRAYFPFFNNGKSRSVSCFQGLSIFWRHFVEQFFGSILNTTNPHYKLAFLGVKIGDSKMAPNGWPK